MTRSDCRDGEGEPSLADAAKPAGISLPTAGDGGGRPAPRAHIEQLEVSLANRLTRPGTISRRSDDY